MDSIVGFTPPADRVPTTARHSLRSVTALRSAASALARSNAPTSVLALRRRPRPAIWPSRHLLDPSCRQFASFHAAKAAHRELLRPRTSYGARSRIASCCPCPPPYQCNVPVGQPAPRSMALRRTSVVNASSRIRPHTGRRAIRRFNPHPRGGDKLTSAAITHRLLIMPATVYHAPCSTARVPSPYLPPWSRMSVLVEIVVGRTQQRLCPSDVFPVTDSDLSVPTHGRGE